MIVAEPMSAKLRAALESLGDYRVKRGLIHHGRRDDSVKRRWAAMHILRNASWSYQAIADHLGMRDHGTVMYGLRRSAKMPDVLELVAHAMEAASGIPELRQLAALFLADLRGEA